jgi:hypothetical protein
VVREIDAAPAAPSTVGVAPLATSSRAPIIRANGEGDKRSFLEGEILVNADGIESRIGAGGLSFTPKGVPHAFLVVSDRARLLSMQSPATGQAFYRGASEPATEDTSETVDIARVQASATENPRGVKLLGPPPFEAARAG